MLEKIPQNRGRNRCFGLGGLVLLWLTAPLAAQREIFFTDHLDFDRPEAWANKFFTSLSLLSPLGVPQEMRVGELELGFEGGLVPHLDRAERTVGFNGTKEEDLNRSPVFGRLRLTVGLPHKFSLTFGVVPPLELDGAKPTLFALALGRPVYETEKIRLGVRLFAQAGKIEGDFTCSARTVAAGNDPRKNPYSCLEPSKDELTPRYIGFELASAFKLPNRRFEPYVALAINHLDLEFQVNARWQGFIDHTLELTDGVTYSLTAGTSLTLSDRFSLVGEAFYTPLDVVRPPRTASQNDPLLNLRGMVRYRLR